LVFEFHDIAERSEVAIHAEDGFGDDENAGLRMFLARPLEVVPEVGRVVVMERTDSGAAEAGAVD
jgi:FKBP-type peptidyl-prolyl cis-trans isomerase 2